MFFFYICCSLFTLLDLNPIHNRHTRHTNTISAPCIPHFKELLQAICWGAIFAYQIKPSIPKRVLEYIVLQLGKLPLILSNTVKMLLHGVNIVCIRTSKYSPGTRQNFAVKHRLGICNLPVLFFPTNILPPLIFKYFPLIPLQLDLT